MLLILMPLLTRFISSAGVWKTELSTRP